MTKTKKHEYQGAAALLLTAFLWGTTFVVQRTGMDHIGPLTFNMMRNLLSALFLGALWIILRAAAGKSILSPEGGGKAALIGGLVCGACLGLGMGLQQVGLKYICIGKEKPGDQRGRNVVRLVVCRILQEPDHGIFV